MNNLERAEQIYRDHASAFRAIESEMERAFGIPTQTTADTVRRIILSQLNDEISATFLRPAPGAMRAFGLYLAAMCYFAFSALAGTKRRPLSADVLFEEWGWRNYRDFYLEIHKALPDADVKVFSTTRAGVFEADFIRPLEVIDRGRQLHFSRAVARKIFLSQAGRFSFYLVLAKRTGLGFVDLALRLMRQIATFETDTANLNAKCLVSAADNAYSALRYFIYKRNGIGNLMLIQNGARVALHAGYSSYIHCDCYFGWSERRLALFHGMRCPSKFAFGSIRQHRAISSLISGGEVRFDILFIEQIIGRPSHGECDHALYLRAVCNLRQLARTHPELKVVYKTRPDREITEDRVKIREIDRLLRGSPVRTDSRSSFSSYDAITAARLIVACDSSMRVEALSMGRNVLSLNYGRSTTDFLSARPDELGVLVEPDYAAFEERVLYLLANETDPQVVKYFNDKRAGLQGVAEDPARCIAEVVSSKL